jgi:hypothetical protein
LLSISTCAATHCKNTLYETLRAVADAGVRAVGGGGVGRSGGGEAEAGDGTVALYNGTNADDLTDPTRLGLLSAARP